MCAKGWGSYPLHRHAQKNSSMGFYKVPVSLMVCIIHPPWWCENVVECDQKCDNKVAMMVEDTTRTRDGRAHCDVPPVLARSIYNGQRHFFPFFCSLLG